MKEFNRGNLDGIRRDINEALKAVEAKHDVSFDLGGIGFEKLKFTVKLTVSIGDGKEYQKTKFEQVCSIFDIPNDWYGKEFTNRGRKYRITAINTRARKMPMEYEDVISGGGYKCSVDHLKTMVKLSK